MGIFHHEGVNGVIARAGIAHRRADHLGLDHSQLSEPVPVGVSECPRVCVRSFIRVRVASRLLELQQVDNLPPRRLLLNSLLPCDLGELEKVPNIADEEFAERRGDQVGCRLALQVETCRHSPNIGPSIMPVRSPPCVGESHRHVNAVSPELLCDAVAARHIRRHEMALHAHAFRVNRPHFGGRLRQIGNDGLDELLCY